jgi:hypothetical protein
MKYMQITLPKVFAILFLISFAGAGVLSAEKSGNNSESVSVENMDEVFSKIKETLKKSPSGMKLSFQRIRGSEVGGSKWDNEEWSYLIEFKSLPSKTDFYGKLCFYDAKGFNLLKKFISIDDVSAYKNSSYSSTLFIPLIVIEKVASVKLEGDGLVGK